MPQQQQDHENHLDEHEARWFAVYTPYKREKLVLHYLQAKGIKAYLPIQKRVRRYKRKVRVVELPLITSYVFVKIVKDEYVPVLETEYVLSFVKFSNNLISIPEEEIELMKRILGDGLEVNVEKSTFQKGDMVEVVSGNLTGIKGKVISIDGKRQFSVNLDFLGYNLLIQIDPKLLRRLEPKHLKAKCSKA